MSVFYRDGTQTFVRKENVEEWQDFVTVTQAREILSRYFLQSATTFDVPIAETLYNLPFHLNYATESVEDETLISYQLALRHHLDTHGVETAVTMNQLALVIEEKLPKPSQLLADYRSHRLIYLHLSTFIYIYLYVYLFIYLFTWHNRGQNPPACMGCVSILTQKRY